MFRGLFLVSFFYRGVDTDEEVIISVVWRELKKAAHKVPLVSLINLSVGGLQADEDSSDRRYELECSPQHLIYYQRLSVSLQ